MEFVLYYQETIHAPGECVKVLWMVLKDNENTELINCFNVAGAGRDQPPHLSNAASFNSQKTASSGCQHSHKETSTLNSIAYAFKSAFYGQTHYCRIMSCLLLTGQLKWSKSLAVGNYFAKHAQK